MLLSFLLFLIKNNIMIINNKNKWKWKSYLILKRSHFWSFFYKYNSLFIYDERILYGLTKGLKPNQESGPKDKESLS